MIDNFPAFAQIFHKSFQRIVSVAPPARGDGAGGNVFVVDVEGDALYAAYLAAFPGPSTEYPKGTNPKFKERTEHDCSCCKQPIRRIGNVVAVTGGGGEGGDGVVTVRTVWDEAAESAPYPYNVVAKALRDLVHAAPIVDLFRVGSNEGSFGSEVTRSQAGTKNVLTGEWTYAGPVITWNHLHTGTIPAGYRSGTPDAVKGAYKTTTQVFQRGLEELHPEAVSTVLDLINSPEPLYKGEEFLPALLAFQRAQDAYHEIAHDVVGNTLAAGRLVARRQNVFVWTNASGPASRFRNTLMGTLVTDLSSGVPLEDAVRAYEKKAAPENYKRTTALITPGMVNKAMETIRELGLEGALERRFARIDDISVNDVKWVDSSTRGKMKGGIGDVLLKHVETTASRDTEADEARAEPINMDDFVAKVLPEATSMEVLFKGDHVGHLMSLTAPVNAHPWSTAPEKPSWGLFRWNNDFAFSYVGNVADSMIKERVKRAGGNISAPLRVSLSWTNGDDLDIHAFEPGTTRGGGPGHIHFRQKRGSGGGVLDVDMNAGGAHSRTPVENITWPTVKDGAYGVVVNNYNKRETVDVGFTVEVECSGPGGAKVSHFHYAKDVKNGADVRVVTLHVKHGVIERFEVLDKDITTTAVSQEKWGLNTESYVKVNAVTMSPNFWASAGNNRYDHKYETVSGADNFGVCRRCGDEYADHERATFSMGNRHTFFVLDGAKNNEPTRGIYNEFLHPRLEKHRKVFEVIGAKTMCQPTEGQLSGLGFSSTKPAAVIVRVMMQGKGVKQTQRIFSVRTTGA